MLALNKMSKPLMEKKRRARINNSLEQLKTLLEKHYSYNVRKRKLEKADILELTVKHIQNLLSMRQEGIAPVDEEGILEYKEGFKGCLDNISAYITKTKTSQKKLELMLLDHLNALDPQAQDGHIQNVQVPPNLTPAEQSVMLYPSHHFIENNIHTLETRNNQWKPSVRSLSGETIKETKQNRRDQYILTEHQHLRSTSSCPNVLQPSNSSPEITSTCWRPW